MNQLDNFIKLTEYPFIKVSKRSSNESVDFLADAKDG